MFAAALGQTATNNKVNAPVGLNLVENDIGFVFELRQHVACFVQNFALVGSYLNNVAEVKFFDWCFKDQCTCIFHSIKENRCDLVADADASGSFVWHAGNVFAKKPQHRVGCRFAR